MAQDTGKIVEWLKSEGQHVTAGEPLVVIETDKAAVDLEAPATGILSRVSARVGDEVPVAQVIAVILAPEEAESAAVSALPASTSTLATGPAPTPSVAVSVAAPAPSTSADGSEAIATPAARNGRRLASPKARRIAAEHGLDIAVLHGSGPGGVVLAADVLAADVLAITPPAAGVAIGPAATLANDAAPPTQPSSPSQPADGEPLSTTWRLMAERTTQSWTSVPHFFLVRDVSAVSFVAWYARAQQRGADKLTYTDLLVKVVAEALRQHHRVNSSWHGDAIVPNEDVNVGIAVATHGGLVVPVIHQAGDLTLTGIARRRADLVARAQQGRLRPHELQGGTFTISNLGMYGIDAFNAIINTPQAAILAVGRVADRVVPDGGQPVVRPMVTLTLSCDHRVVDGARGAQFLATVAALIEDPSALPD
jgi:pyruvate dehydrogenase E2 component (dihydrolipoamide acetyltransferase)